jgi:hypothetical protein
MPHHRKSAVVLATLLICVGCASHSPKGDAEVAATPQTKEITLVMGIGRTVSVSGVIGKVQPSDPKVCRYRKIADADGKARRLLLVPSREGSATLTLNDESDRALMTVTVQVSGSPNRETLDRLKAEEKKDGLEMEEVTVAKGVGRNLRTPFDIGSVFLTDPNLFVYLGHTTESEPRDITLIPRKKGITDLLVQDKEGKQSRKYYIEVVDEPTPQLIEKQKSDENAIGITAEELSLSSGDEKSLEFSFPVGPIYLTDPKQLSFSRLWNDGAVKSITLNPLGPGLTTLTIHDDTLRAKVKYYLRTVGGTLNSERYTRTPAHAKTNRPARFYDLEGGEVVPVY